jgi:Fe2+ transport system protein FeoA
MEIIAESYKSLSLADMPVSESACITSIESEHPSLLRRLLSLGFVSGKPVSIIKRGLFGDPLLASCGDTVFTLRASEAHCIKVQKV